MRQPERLLRDSVFIRCMTIAHGTCWKAGVAFAARKFRAHRETATFLRQTTQAVTALLVLMMSTILVLPPGMDLVLCFDKDGDIDFLLNGCPSTSPKIPTKDRSPIAGTTQNGGCIDETVACSMAQGLVRSDGKWGSNASAPKRDPAKMPFLFPEALADFFDTFLDRSVYPIPLEEISSSHLVFLRTVVLLI